VHAEPDAHVDPFSDAVHHALFDAEPVELVRAHGFAQRHRDPVALAVVDAQPVPNVYRLGDPICDAAQQPLCDSERDRHSQPVCDPVWRSDAVPVALLEPAPQPVWLPDRNAINEPLSVDLCVHDAVCDADPDVDADPVPKLHSDAVPDDIPQRVSLSDPVALAEPQRDSLADADTVVLRLQQWRRVAVHIVDAQRIPDPESIADREPAPYAEPHAHALRELVFELDGHR
jgi:hypothetical protein